MEKIRFKRGQVISREGDRPSGIYFVMNGEVAVSKRIEFDGPTKSTSSKTVKSSNTMKLSKPSKAADKAVSKDTIIYYMEVRQLFYPEFYQVYVGKYY